MNKKGNIDRLRETLKESLDKIETSEKSLKNLHIDQSLKNQLKEIFVETKKTLLTAEPILTYINEVRDLILTPVQTGIKKSFDESNKWGILGIKISIISMLATLITGIGGIIYSYSIANSESKNKVGIDVQTLSSSQDSTQINTCFKPKIVKLLTDYNSNKKSKPIYISGDCLDRNYRLTIDDLDINYQIVNDNLIQINEFPIFYKNLKLKIEYISGIFEDKFCFVQPLNPSLKMNKLSLVSKNYVDSIIIEKIQEPTLKNIFQIDTTFTLGHREIFGVEYSPEGNKKKFLFEKNESNNQNQKFIKINSIGIDSFLPGDYTESGISINNHFYSFDHYIPCKGILASERTCNFIIPLKNEHFVKGSNTIEFLSGQYKKSNSEITFENYIIKKFTIFEKS